MQVKYEDAVEWLDQKLKEAIVQDEADIIEYIQEMLWRYEDMSNS